MSDPNEPRVLTAAGILHAMDIMRNQSYEPEPTVVSPASARWIDEQGGFEAAIRRIVDSMIEWAHRDVAQQRFERQYARQRANKRRRDRRR